MLLPAAPTRLATGVISLIAIVLAWGSLTVKSSPASGHSLPTPAAAIEHWRSSHWAGLTGRVVLVRRWTIHYRAASGVSRIAIVLLPRWYGPNNDPPIPLVISPHGRGVEPAANADIWGNMPALARFGVVNPEGQGRTQELYSWGSPAQISDLARMPTIVRRALPWLRIAPRRIYAIGGSMGGQETLLLAAEHPRLLKGAISFDAPTIMVARYRAFRSLRNGRRLQQLARLEFGGAPRLHSQAWIDRSPMFEVRELAAGDLPLQIWWSTRDRIVVNQSGESGLLYRTIMHLNPAAPVTQHVGAWRHTAEMRPLRKMPWALAELGLLRVPGIWRAPRP